MLLEDIIANPDRALDYLERYVNDGSPSGFTEIHTTSWPTSPSSLNAKYRMYYFCVDAQNVRTFGQIPNVTGVRDQNSFIFVHPDMVELLNSRGIKNFLKYTDSDVIPTASSRTVRFDRCHNGV